MQPGICAIFNYVSYEAHNGVFSYQNIGPLDCLTCLKKP